MTTLYELENGIAEIKSLRQQVSQLDGAAGLKMITSDGGNIGSLRGEMGDKAIKAVQQLYQDELNIRTAAFENKYGIELD